MEYILERFLKNVKEGPDQPFFYDDKHPNGLTYAEFDDYSGRVYAWLKAQGIGREDFVLINLPRGIMPLIAALGVWKAGAAFVIVEDNYAPERVAFIRRDCECKVEVNLEAGYEIMYTEPLPGYEPTDPHDAAFAVYTSGTTGKPKGVLHEYGNLERCIQSLEIEGNVMFRKGIFRPFASPLTFVAAVIALVAMLWADHARMYIVPYDTAKDPDAFLRLFQKYRFNMVFLSPSYARLMAPQLAQYLKVLLLASEPANGFYIQGPDIRNLYSSSESLFMVGTFQLDHAYDIAPVGKPSFPLDIRLLDEDGREVPDGEIGEVTFETPYFRGYTHCPEETEKAFRGGVFHMGDLARRDPEGNLVIVGRVNDMVKINGNRVEPAEIESVFKRLTGIDWAAARAFTEEGGGFVCVYYTANIDIDTGELRRSMADYLPNYMIPSHFIHIDEIPLRPNGKLDRGALPAPEVQAMRREYAAPADEIEAALCKGFEEVLGIGQIGVMDDFYELGGDSLRAIELVMICDLPKMNAGMVFRGRTPRGIAALYLADRSVDEGKSLDEINREALSQPQPLTTEQIYMQDVQFYTPKSTMYNLFTMLEVDRGSLDAEKLAAAVGTAIQWHPALLSIVFFNKDSELMQRYVPERFEPIRVERCSEAEFQRLKDELVQPYKIFGELLYRCRVFETEQHIYLFFDVHHIMFDGGSYRLFLEDIARAYLGGAPRPDYYYMMLEKRKRDRQSQLYWEGKSYFEALYGDGDWTNYPKIDHGFRENRLGELTFPLALDMSQLEAAENALHVGHNEFFIGAALMAVAVYNQTNHVKLSWIYNGRDERDVLYTVGLLYRDLPVAIRLEDCADLHALYNQVREQVRGGIEYSCFPYVEEGLTWDNKISACVLYQRSLNDAIYIGDVRMKPIEIRHNRDASQTILDISILECEAGLELGFDYVSTLYDQESMERFGNLIIRIARETVHAVLEDENADMAGFLGKAGEL